MKIAVIGTGAMGSLFAALLAPHAHVVMIGSWPEQLIEVSQRGLVLCHIDGRESRQILAAATSGAEAAPADFAIIAVKGWQTRRAAQNAQQSLSLNGLAVTLQNGLGNLEIIAGATGTQKAVQGVTSEGATMLRAGFVRHAGRGHTFLAATQHTRGRLDELAQLFNDAGLATSVVEDAQSLIWGKLAVNAGINPLTALLQVPNGFLVESAPAFEIMRRAAEETSAVAAAHGIALPYDDAGEQAAAVARATAANRSSMAQDIAHGKPTEIEQITGEIIRRGQALNVPTPVNSALYTLIRAQIDNGSWAAAIPQLSPELRSIFGEFAG